MSSGRVGCGRVVALSDDTGCSSFDRRTSMLRHTATAADPGMTRESAARHPEWTIRDHPDTGPGSPPPVKIAVCGQDVQSHCMICPQTAILAAAAPPPDRPPTAARRPPTADRRPPTAAEQLTA